MPSRRSLLVLESISAHVAVLVAILVASLMATGTIPTPANRLAFEIDRTVRFIDITLPPQRATRQQTRSAESAVPAPSPVSAAPTAAPPSITPDTSSDTGADIGPGPTAAAVADPANALQELGIVETPPTVPVVPQAPIRLGNLVPPRKTFNVDPLYPSLARSARVEGVVVLEAVIDRLGRVESVRVLRSIPLLDPAALDAVRQWRFTPTLLNGTPVSIVMVVTVNFSLSAR